MKNTKLPLLKATIARRSVVFAPKMVVTYYGDHEPIDKSDIDAVHNAYTSLVGEMLRTFPVEAYSYGSVKQLVCPYVPPTVGHINYAEDYLTYRIADHGDPLR